MENKRIRKILIFFLVVNLIILLFAIIIVINKDIEILYKNYKG